MFLEPSIDETLWRRFEFCRDGFPDPTKRLELIADDSSQLRRISRQRSARPLHDQQQRIETALPAAPQRGAAEKIIDEQRHVRKAFGAHARPPLTRIGG